MWHRILDPAREAVHKASTYSDRYLSKTATTGHLMLGLLDEESCVARRALAHMGLDLDKLRGEVDSKIERGWLTAPKKLTIAPDLMRTLKFASEETGNPEHGKMCTEHLLLGMIRERNGIAGRVLSKHGVTLQKARAAIRHVQRVKPST